MTFADGICDYYMFNLFMISTYQFDDMNPGDIFFKVQWVKMFQIS